MHFCDKLNVSIIHILLRERKNKMGLVGRQCPGCNFCIHANREEMKCYPESEDCKSEYDLEESDFYTEARCDFFEDKRRVKK